MSEQDVASIAKAIRWNDFTDDDLVTDHVAARLLAISVHTMRRWRGCDPPEGPRHLRLGTSIRYKIGDLRTYLHRSTVITGGDPEPTSPKFRSVN